LSPCKSRSKQVATKCQNVHCFARRASPQATSKRPQIEGAQFCLSALHLSDHKATQIENHKTENRQLSPSDQTPLQAFEGGGQVVYELAFDSSEESSVIGRPSLDQ
jgi:hypothetical protein